MSRSCWGKTVLAAVDQFLCLIVLFPLCIFHWRGTWHLQAVYLAPHRYVLSSTLSLILGSVLCPLLYLIQPSWVRILKRRSRWVYVIGIRIFLYFNGWAILGFWRGLWNLTDWILTEGWVNSVVVYVIAQVISIASRTVRTNAGLPLSINIDIDEDLDRPDTRFAEKSAGKWYYVLDVLYSQFVITTCNVLVWRGIWNVLDAFFYPQDPLFSSVASLVVGQGIVALLFLMSPLMAIASTRLDTYHLIFKLAYENLIFLLGTWGVLMAWRGGWDLCREYVIPDMRIGGWVCHTVGVTGLFALQAFSSVGTNGIDIDGTYSEGTGLFPTSYIRHYLEKRTLEVKYKSLPQETMELAGKVLNGHSEGGFQKNSRSATNGACHYPPEETVLPV